MRGMLYRDVPFKIEVFQSRRDTTIMAFIPLTNKTQSLVIAENMRDAIRMAREEIDEILDRK